MKNKNLFIVNTPFHLLTTFILSHSCFADDDNYLALLHPHGYGKWQDSLVMRHMSSTSGGWRQVFFLGNWLSSRHKTKSFRQQVAEIRDTIGRIKIDAVFLGSDMDVQNQLLVSALNISQFYRYEDGLYSYYNEDRRRTLPRRLFHQGKIQALKILAGINGKISINTTVSGDSPAGIGDFLYKPELLQRFSPQTLKIEQAMIQQALRELAGKDLFHPVMAPDSILYLSQPLVELKKLSREEELAILREILRQLNGKGCLLYKPHPNDSDAKLDYYCRTLPGLSLYNSVEPVELSFAYEENLKAIISYQSSALMFTDTFTPRKIKSVSLGKFYQQPMHPAYMEIMCKAGVCFPQDLEGLAELLAK
ncbi:polysialyltransferase family glycosyltransferase [Sporomusa aerivorans]|uniref:polysialyltransferase family glycosyltransferase n=1 Tax=Sporomusa aerivorans TaxID=204936 RepID=UPI00352A6C11